MSQLISKYPISHSDILNVAQLQTSSPYEEAQQRGHSDILQIFDESLGRCTKESYCNDLVVKVMQVSFLF